MARNLLLTLALVTCIFTTVPGQQQQKVKLDPISKHARDDSLSILDEMRKILKTYYYDQTFHGTDLDARIKEAKTRVKGLTYNWQMYRVLVQVLLELNDSHTRMFLPPRKDFIGYGIRWQMFGDDCYVTWVDPSSDAAAKGVEAGDRLVTIGNFTPTRGDLWKIDYLLLLLENQDHLDLKYAKPNGAQGTVTVLARKNSKELLSALNAQKKPAPFTCIEIDSSLGTCRLESFDVDKDVISKMMKFASRYSKMIFDLRGNPGGYVDTEVEFLSYFFDHKVKVADIVTKKKTEQRFTRTLDPGRRYTGDIAILVDSQSASAAEITARVLQIEKRARVYGDVSSGSVMTSIGVPFESIVDAFAIFAIIRVGMSVTIGDVIMSDGARLENVGVVPDELELPTARAIKLNADSLLAYAAQKMGAKLDPIAAGKFGFVGRAELLPDFRDEKLSLIP